MKKIEMMVNNEIVAVIEKDRFVPLIKYEEPYFAPNYKEWYDSCFFRKRKETSRLVGSIYRLCQNGK